LKTSPSWCVPRIASQNGKTCLASSFASVLYFAGQEEAAKKLDLCIAQNELKQGLLLNRNFVNAVNALGIKGAQNENVPAEII
jgi:hypothetical protein